VELDNPRGDSLKGKKPKVYSAGDQIHIAVTQNFEEVATEFFQFCNENHYNPSEVIRSSMEQWLKRQKRIKELMEESVEMDARSSMEKEKRIVRRLKEEGVT
jgi:predicted transcriptional regulator YheO